MKKLIILLFLLLSCYTLYNPFTKQSYEKESSNYLDEAIKINYAMNKTIYTSSFLGVGYEETNANDGNYITYWSSLYNDNELITIDLGSIQNVDYIKIYWNTNYATEYRINTSDNGIFFSQVYYTNTSTGGAEQISINNLCQFIEFELILRNSTFGFEIYEIEVYLK
jgi:hexosaminidase